VVYLMKVTVYYLVLLAPLCHVTIFTSIKKDHITTQSVFTKGTYKGNL